MDTAVQNAVNQVLKQYKFKTVAAASKFVAEKKGVDVLSARDCLYKALRCTGRKTHGYNIKRDTITKEITLIEL